MTGNAKWCCSSDGTFTTPEPDRSGCQEIWINDIDNQIDNGTIPATDIVNDVNKQLMQSNTSISGGGMVSLVDSMNRAIDLRSRQLLAGNVTYQESQSFAQDSYSTYDILLGSILSWQELTDPWLRYNTSSNIFISVTELSTLTINSLYALSSSYCPSGMSTYQYPTLEVILSTLQPQDSNEEIHVRPLTYSDVSITVQPNLLLKQPLDVCVGTMTVFYNIEVTSTQMFPDVVVLNRSEINDKQAPPGLYNKIVEFSFSKIDGTGGFQAVNGANGVEYIIDHMNKVQ